LRSAKPISLKSKIELVGLLTDSRIESFITDSKALKYILCGIIFDEVIYIFIN